MFNVNAYMCVDGLYLPSPLPSPALPLKRQGSGSSNSGVRKRRKNYRHRAERQVSSERQNGEVSTSASGQSLTQTYIVVYVTSFMTSCRLTDGGVCAGTVCRGNEVCPCGGPHSWLVPAMLSPPESLLIACIRRGNYIEAQQVRYSYNTSERCQFTYIL